MTNTPITYKDFTIQLQGNGFRIIPNVSGKVASFWVVNKENKEKKIRSIFAFARSLMDSFENVGESEDKILDSAVSLIKKYIDDGSIQDLEEYPFEYKSHQFLINLNANWWTKTLKTQLVV